MVDYIVCGWFTPDYKSYAAKLRACLDRLGEPHDFVPAPKRNGGWEANTMAKAQHVLDAMNRHPGKTLLFLDVDCEVLGSLAPLAQGRADVGFFVQEAVRKNGRARALVRSGTLALKPTARPFVERWAEHSRMAAYGDVDQDTLLRALATSGVTFEHIDVRWCCTRDDDCLSPAIFHDHASRSVHKISYTRRRLMDMTKRWRLTRHIWHAYR